MAAAKEGKAWVMLTVHAGEFTSKTTKLLCSVTPYSNDTFRPFQLSRFDNLKKHKNEECWKRGRKTFSGEGDAWHGSCQCGLLHVAVRPVHPFFATLAAKVGASPDLPSNQLLFGLVHSLGSLLFDTKRCLSQESIDRARAVFAKFAPACSTAEELPPLE